MAWMVSVCGSPLLFSIVSFGTKPTPRARRKTQAGLKSRILGTSRIFFFFIYKHIIMYFVNIRSDTDRQHAKRAARWRESDCVLDRHGRRGWSPGGRMPGRDAHGQGRRT